MDLIKSIEKAKKERHQAGAGQQPAKDHPGARASVDDLNLDQAPWDPPVFDQSQKVVLDPDLVEAHRCVGLYGDEHESDHYNVVRTQIQNMTQEKGWNTVMITSAQPGEGKTITSINLAFSFAKAYNQTVLLVDNDLRRQSIYRYLGIRSKYGLIDHLTRDIPLEKIIKWPADMQKIVFISGGKTINSGSELMGSPQMKTMVREMKTRYTDRYVFFDTPPLLVGADAMTFASLADAIVMVVEAGSTPREDVQRAYELIPKEKFLGFILNREKRSSRSYYKYNYYYK